MDADGDAPVKPPQGWFGDPFGDHESRWFSQGTPTALVRDGRKEAQDPPPEPTWTGPLTPAAIAPATAPPSDDMLRAGDRGPTFEPDGQFGFLGDPALPGTEGAPTTAAQATGFLPMFAFRGGGPPPTPKRLVTYRWVALGLAVGWTLVLTLLILSATSTSRSGAGRETTTRFASSDPVGVLLFVVFLLACDGIVAVGLLRRIRADSESAGRSGYVVAGLLFVLGVLSLATVGLALIILAFALWVVARPIRRPRPMPGERLT